MPEIQVAQVGRFTGVRAGFGGDRPPVLLVHGAFSCPAQMQTLLVAFSERGYATYALALAGHGGAGSGSVHGKSIGDYVRDTVEAARLIGNPLVVGHSMGGLIATKVAESGAARAAVIIAAAPPAPVMVTRQSASTFIKLLPRVLSGTTITPPLAALQRLTLGNVDAAKRDSILSSFVPESGVAFRDMVLGRVRVDPDQLRCPVLAVYGDRDLLVPPWQMRAAAKRLRAVVMEPPGSGHALFEEPNGPAIVRDIVGWCDQVAASPA
jgi:pimeloyl-ACP methyl ester carboxylesterase